MFVCLNQPVQQILRWSELNISHEFVILVNIIAFYPKVLNLLWIDVLLTKKKDK